MDIDDMNGLDRDDPTITWRGVVAAVATSVHLATPLGRLLLIALSSTFPRGNSESLFGPTHTPIWEFFFYFLLSSLS